MQQKKLGKLFTVSSLALGGGGTGQVWGETSRAEAIATTQLAYDSGITLFDMAPMYGRGEAEEVMGLSFPDGYPDDLRMTTKCLVGGITGNEIEDRLTSSLEESLKRMKRTYIDVYILHGHVIPDGWTDAIRPDLIPSFAVEFSVYVEYVVPTYQKLIRDGKIGSFGITASNIAAANLAVFEHDTKPSVVQCVTNLLDSGMAVGNEPSNPRGTISLASKNSIGVMGIRAVAAGALTDSLDRYVKQTSEVAKDFAAAETFRQIAADMGVSAANLAHRYALSMADVDTVVLGVKNRSELKDCVHAASMGPLSEVEVARIDQSVTHPGTRPE